MKNKKLRYSLFAGSALVALLLIVNLAWSYSASAAFDQAVDELAAEVPSLELGSYERVYSIPSSDNAARWAQAGAGLIDRDTPAREALTHITEQPITDADPETRAQLAAFLDSHRTALDLIAEGQRAGDSSFSLFYRRGVEMEIPNLLDFLHAGRLLLADAQLAAAEGRAEDAIRAVDGLRTLVFALSKDHPAIMQLIAYRCETLYAYGIRALIEAGIEDPEILDRHISTPGPSHDQRYRSMVGVEAGSIRQLRHELSKEGGLLQHLLFTLADGPITQSLANILDYNRRVLSLGGATASELVEGRHSETLRLPSEWIPGMSLAFAQDSILIRARAAEARDQLRGLAIELYLEALRSGAYPTDLSAYPAAASNPMTGEAIAYSPTPEGGAMIDISGALETMDRHYGSQGVPENLRRRKMASFRWQLPPVGDAATNPGADGR